MMRTKPAFALAALCVFTLSIVGCTASGAGGLPGAVANADAQIEQRLNEVCPRLEAAHSAFVLAGIFFTIPAGVNRAAQDAYATAQVFCESPEAVTVVNAPTKVLDAIEKIEAAHDKAS